MDWIATILSSAAVVGLIKLIELWLGHRGALASRQIERQGTIEDRFYAELESRIEWLEKRLSDAEARAEKWQAMYAELFANYKQLQAQREADRLLIETLQKQVDALRRRQREETSG